MPPAGLDHQPPRNLIGRQLSVQDVPDIRDDLGSQPKHVLERTHSRVAPVRSDRYPPRPGRRTID